MKALIVDDEFSCRETLENLLKRYTSVNEIHKAENILSAEKQIQQLKPDIVFLDIEMPGGNGFELLGKFKEIFFDVIFTTAFDHFAIKAIKFSAVDYLLKPVDPDELQEAVSKVFLKKEKSQTANQRLQTLINNIQSPSSKPNKIAIPEGDGYSFLSVSEIVRCESDGNYTLLYLTEGKKILASKTLGDFEELLSGQNFFRVHRSHLVNLERIKKYIKGEGGYVVLEDNSQVEVSRRKKAEFLERLAQV